MRFLMSRTVLYIAIFKILFVAGIAAWWLIAEPSHNRNWSPEYAKLPLVSWIGTSTVAVRNIRDWHFSDSTFPSEQPYRDETFDIDTLTNTWFFIEPFSTWSGVGHTFFSFEFANGQSVVVSVEARKEIGEEYSGFRSLLPTYEYMYVWATERDMLTNTVYFEKDDVYRYPLTISLDSQKELFKTLIKGTDALSQQPRFYHLFGANCTNILARHANIVRPGSVPLHYSWFLTGYSDTYLYNLGYITHDRPFTEIEQEAFLTPIVRSAIAAGSGTSTESFSAHLRKK